MNSSISTKISLTQFHLLFSKEKSPTKEEQMEYQKAVRSETLYHKDLNVAGLVCTSPSWLQWYLTGIMGGKDPDAIGYVTIRAWYSLSSGNFYVKGIWADIEDGDRDTIGFYHLTIPGDSSVILESDWTYDDGYRDVAKVVELDMYPTDELILPEDAVEVYQYELITERHTTSLDLYLAVTHPSGQLEMELIMRLGAKRLAELLTSPKEIKSEQ